MSNAKVFIKLALLSMMACSVVFVYHQVSKDVIPIPDVLQPYLANYDKYFKKRIVELEGPVDDCMCDVETVDICVMNTDNVHQILEEISQKNFFKYFKVDYLKDCPFWEDDSVCSVEAGGNCGVSPCSEEELPPALKEELRNCRQTKNQKDSPVDATLPEKDPPRWDDTEDDLWIEQDSEAEFMSYVNLELNPEKYTGYGATSQRDTAALVWKAIYEENCFSDSPLHDQCMEERVFYRLISGFHASTTAHICENFQNNRGELEPNEEFFLWKLGMFPDRMQNIYFTFLFLLRAAQQAQSNLISYPYQTGHADDGKIPPLLNDLFNSQLVCNDVPPFDESTLFSDPDKESLKYELRDKFRNISRIMDCVSCETCKVHAKLQILGIGTALRILFDRKSSEPLKLQRNEVIALMNSLFKFAESIQFYQNFIAREKLRVNLNTALLFWAISMVANATFVLLRMIFSKPVRSEATGNGREGKREKDVYNIKKKRRRR